MRSCLQVVHPHEVQRHLHMILVLLSAQLHQPLAIAVIGGFLAALPLLLIVLPAMLQILYRKGDVDPHKHLAEPAV